MKDITQTNVSTSTIRRALHLEGYIGRVGLRKPLVNEVNHCKRQNWCQKRLSWDIQWDQIVWSDESRFELFGSNRRKWVWRPPEQKIDIDCLVSTYKSGQKSVMVWGCFTRFGVGPLVRLEGRLAAKDYINLLEMHLMPFLETLSEETFTFQYDNAPIHT